MKIFSIFFLVCLAVCSSLAKNKGNKPKFYSQVYCDALDKANVLSNSSDHTLGEDPMKNCHGRCNVERLSVMWLPNSLETKLQEQHLDDVIMYYNLYKLQSWLAGQIRFKGCLAPGKTFTSRNCKLRCCEIQSAIAQINILFTHFPYQKAKSQFKKIRRRALKAFKNDKYTEKMVKRHFKNKSFKSAKKLAKKTSSCLLHTSYVSNKLTVLCRKRKF